MTDSVLISRLFRSVNRLELQVFTFIISLQAVDWNVPKPNGGVNDYIELLVKETVTLHKVLSRYLSAAVVEVRW